MLPKNKTFCLQFMSFRPKYWNLEILENYLEINLKTQNLQLITRNNQVSRGRNSSTFQHFFFRQDFFYKGPLTFLWYRFIIYLFFYYYLFFIIIFFSFVMFRSTGQIVKRQFVFFNYDLSLVRSVRLRLGTLLLRYATLT